MGSALAVAILAGGAALSAAGAPNRVGGSGGDGGGAATGAGAGALAATVDATLLGGLVLARRAVGVFSRPPPSAPPALLPRPLPPCLARRPRPGRRRLRGLPGATLYRPARPGPGPPCGFGHRQAGVRGRRGCRSGQYPGDGR
jgi:hypothetical protein